MSNLDAVRREKTRAEKEPELQYEVERLQDYDAPTAIDDDTVVVLKVSRRSESTYRRIDRPTATVRDDRAR